jgi:4-amino-4-deoxy-L-arabinose transferase-like glycosyltransferase
VKARSQLPQKSDSLVKPSSSESQNELWGERTGLPWQWGLLLLVLALAVGVRCTTLSFQSLWLDEVSTVIEAGRPWSSLFLDLFRPFRAYPLYILSMAVWGTLFGTTEVALRLPSAIAGVCSVPLLYALGRRLFGRRVALLAAGFLALSPLAVWYSQEATTYALSLLLTVIAWLLLWDVIERPSRRAWWALGGITLLALSVHRLLAVLSIVGQLVYVVYVAQRGRFSGGPHLGQGGISARRHRRLLMGMLFCVLLVSLGIVWFWFDRSGAGRQFGTQRDWTDLVNTFSQFSLRIHPGPPEPGQGPDRRPWLFAFAVAALAGLVSLALDARSSGRRRRRALFLLSFLCAPIGSFFLLYAVRPFYHERYLLCALPAYLLLLAVGVAALWRWASRLAQGGRTLLSLIPGTLALATVLIPLAVSWRQVQDWTLARRPSKEQFREATRYLQEHVHPGDLVVVHPGYILDAVEHYQARSPRMRLELDTVRDLYTTDYDFRDFEAHMDDLVRGRRRAWLYLAPYHSRTQDAKNWVYEWFWLNPFLHCGESTFNGIELYCISFNEQYRDGFPTPTVFVDARYADDILLWGADLEPFQSPLRPGDSLPLTLFVEGLRKGLPDLEIVVRLVGQEGRVWAELARRPLDGGLPTTFWKPGDWFLDYYELLLPDEIPAGLYRVEVGYRPPEEPSAWLLLPDGGIWTTLGSIEVVPRGGSR